MKTTTKTISFLMFVTMLGCSYDGVRDYEPLPLNCSAHGQIELCVGNSPRQLACECVSDTQIKNSIIF
jgi:hypothetical protein